MDPNAPAPLEPKKNNTMMIVAVVAVVVLCCCCIGAALLWQYGDLITNSLG